MKICVIAERIWADASDQIHNEVLIVSKTAIDEVIFLWNIRKI